VDNYIETLRRAAINCADSARRYLNAINRLITAGHLETLYRYHAERKTQVSIHNTDKEPWSPVEPRCINYVVTEADLRVLENENSWQYDDFTYNMAEHSVRLNEREQPNECDGWYNMPEETCISLSVNPNKRCYVCRADMSYKMSVVRLVLMRQGNEHTFVSFDDTNEEHMAAAKGRTEERSEYGYLVQLWSEKLGKYVFRDTDVNDWNIDWTVEYHAADEWYQDCIEYEEDKEYQLGVDEGWNW
jgi:hypothetical protein